MMFRLTASITLATAAIATLNAGQIQIGSGVNGANGLTAYVSGNGYMNTVTGPGVANQSCAGAALFAAGKNAGFDGCAKAATGNGEKEYATLLFENASGGGFTAPSGSSFTDSTGTTFARISDTNKNFWAAHNGADVVVPIGILGVSRVSTMLNNYWGATGFQDTQVIFTWSSTSSWGNGATTQSTVTLTNGVDIRSAVNCQTPAGCKVNMANGVSTDPGDVQIANTLTGANSQNVFSTPYTSIGPFSGFTGYTTPGTIVLDSQYFDFGTSHATDYLVSITIRNGLAGYGGGALTTGNSRVALSAVTVETVPEPSTIFLSFAGLAAVGYFRRRRA